VSVVVIGSIHCDLIVRTEQRPVPGETAIGLSFRMASGGKGLNQAVQSAKMGVRTYMVGRIGDDPFGDIVRRTMQDANVEMNHVQIDPAGTGIGNAWVDQTGEYAAIVISRANVNVSDVDIMHALSEPDTKVVLLQLELPIHLVQFAAKAAKKAGKFVILNAAPARALDPDLLSHLDVLVVNEIELMQVTVNFGNSNNVMTRLQQLGELVPHVVVTLGKKGALLASRNQGNYQIDSWELPVKDTLGAGDAFVGAFAASVDRGLSLIEAARYACAAGALCVTREGASASDFSEIEQFVLSHPSTLQKIGGSR
jgi:ribokinase